MPVRTVSSLGGLWAQGREEEGPHPTRVLWVLAKLSRSHRRVCIRRSPFMISPLSSHWPQPIHTQYILTGGTKLLPDPFHPQAWLGRRGSISSRPQWPHAGTRHPVDGLLKPYLCLNTTQLFLNCKATQSWNKAEVGQVPWRVYKEPDWSTEEEEINT